ADPKGKKILILGAGGAAKAIAYQLASEAKEIKILNRTGKKAEEIANHINEHFGKKASGENLTPNILERCLEDVDILINATSVGMYPNKDQTLVKKEWLRPEITVMDIIYNPVETRLIKDAKAIGAKVIYGTEMLIYQGAASFEIWFRRKAPVEVMREAILTELKKLQEKNGNACHSR
ncbi:saccharopine dehydrogenase NADP-binding domain-containing protein, partial [Candidatus Bathyarchaeota archaeon]|nr:saccharopine dehydrogenase NADP-binding domain-containing protein [Candidatus Bathyarchaeota archaeon]